jgi:3-isopropylmalate/(R)-2-methylmalate dehydratase small subunit
MKKEVLTTIISTAVPLHMENVDTDQIYPARYLKTVSKKGLGNMLFRDWRFDMDGKAKSHFILNNTDKGSAILLAGYNFGCGSSREHAAWALADYGFKAVVSSFFGDIFRNNALNNSLLPIQVTPYFLNLLFDEIGKNPRIVLKIDIQTETISIPSKKMQEQFVINKYKKLCVMKGFDDIDYILSQKKRIIAFEIKRKHDFSLL